MLKPKVYIYTPVDQSGESHKRIAEAGCELRLGRATWQNIASHDNNYLLDLDPDTSVLVGVAARHIPITRQLMERAPNLRLVAKYTVGVDDIDVAAASDLGILITHCPTEANWGGVAEGTIAFILAFLKKVRERDRHVKHGGWRDRSLIGTYLGRRLDGYPGIIIGIIGLGRIGTRVADLLAPWRVRILGYDPYVDESKFVLHNTEPVDLETLLKNSDVITLHCNLTQETMGLIGSDQLAMMKADAILINTARGPIVDVDALFEALKKNRIAGTAIDVLPKEPPDPKLPLLSLGDKVLFSPHMITVNRKGGLEPAIQWATEAVISALKGEIPEHVYNMDVVPLWRERFGGKSLLNG